MADPPGSSVASEVAWTTSKPAGARTEPASQARVSNGPGKREVRRGWPRAASGSGRSRRRAAGHQFDLGATRRPGQRVRVPAAGRARRCRSRPRPFAAAVRPSGGSGPCSLSSSGRPSRPEGAGGGGVAVEPARPSAHASQVKRPLDADPARPAASTSAPPSSTVDQGGRPVRRRPRADQHGAVAHHLGHGARRGGHHRHPGGHGLQRGEPEALVARRVGQHRRAAEGRVQGPVVEVAGPHDPVPHRRRVDGGQVPLDPPPVATRR